MTETEKFEQRRRDMPDDELADKADRWVSDLCTGKRAFKMCVPPRIDDTDMILSEIIRRFRLLTTPRPVNDGKK